MRLIYGFLMTLAVSLPAQAGLFDDLKVAVTGHIADFQSRSEPDQVLENAKLLTKAMLRTDDPGQDRLHYGSGTVSLVELDGTVYIQLHEDVEIGFAPDLYLYLSPEPGISDEAAFNATEQIEVAKVVKGKGASYYSLGAVSMDQLAQARSITVWCRQFNEFMASGDFDRM